MLSLAAVSFITSIILTPGLTDFLYRHRERLGKQIREETEAPVYYALHKEKKGTPTMGGILIWGTTILVLFFFWALARVSNSFFFHQFNFWDRGETYLPFGLLILAAFVGLADDILGAFKRGAHGGGIQVRWKLFLYTIIASVGAWWFYVKIDRHLLYIPFFGSVDVGFWYIPIFLLVVVATTFSANETDGLDGLLGGVSVFTLGALSAVAFSQGMFHLATFLSVIIGSLLAFLWFNIFPARFFMGDTGSMALGITIGVVAMFTNTALFLPFFAFIFVLESASVLVQLFWKRVIGKKFFASTPLHHHFEAGGWPEPKVVMRFWIISAVMASVGLILYVASSNIIHVLN